MSRPRSPVSFYSSVPYTRLLMRYTFSAVAEIFAGKEHLITSNVVKSLRGFLVANNTPPQLISQELASMFRACNTEDIQPPRTLLRAVILALLGSGAGERSRTTFDLLFTNRNPKTNFQLLSLLFRSKGLASGKITQPPHAPMDF